MARYDDLLQDLLNEDADDTGTSEQLNDASYTLAYDDSVSGGTGNSQHWRYQYEQDERSKGRVWYEHEAYEEPAPRDGCALFAALLGGGLLTGLIELVRWFA